MKYLTFKTLVLVLFWT